MQCGNKKDRTLEGKSGKDSFTPKQKTEQVIEGSGIERPIPSANRPSQP